MHLQKDELLAIVRHKNKVEVVEDKKALRDKINAQMEDFLRQGKAIEKVPSGMETGTVYGREYAAESEAYQRGREILKKKRAREKEQNGA
jgi:predicted DNA-binding helix-hairpin-helix protein